MKNDTIYASLLFAVLFTLAPPLRAQAAPQSPADPDQPIATLKVATRVVTLSAVVRGKDGAPHGGLTKDDFLLRQDGQDEPIRYFSQGSELPLTLALLVDTSGSQRTFIGDESLASDIFFETMLQRPQDRAMLVEFDQTVLQLRGLTASANALHLALLGLSAHPATANGTLLQDTVYTVSRNILANESGRKAIVILSDGGDNGSRHSLAEAVEQAQRADVQVYSILYSLADMFPGPRPTAAEPGRATSNASPKPPEAASSPSPAISASEKSSPRSARTSASSTNSPTRHPPTSRQTVITSSTSA